MICFNSQTLIFKRNGLTLVEVLVGTFLILIVFLGIFGVYQLGLKVVGQSKARIDATALANQQLETVKNLPYEEVGINETGCHPCGTLERTDSIVRNNIEYTIETIIRYIADSADGLAAPEDSCPNDYKKVEIKVFWSGEFSGEISLSTDIAPKNLAQECGEGGGILSVSVYDVGRNPIPGSLIEIKDPADDHTVDSAIASEEGKYNFPLLPGEYKVVVSYSDYNSERTYRDGEEYNGKIIGVPEKPNPLVIDGELTPISFIDVSAIDKLSAFSVDTFSTWGADSFLDSFSDSSKISEPSNIAVANGEVKLSETDGQYAPSGYLISITISPEDLIHWDEFSFSDNEPAETQILYQVLYFDEEDWVLIPNSVLPGNSAGFGDSPVGLSELNITTYSQLELQANLSTTSVDTPVLHDWQVSWKTSEATPIANADFRLQGAKIVGHDNTSEEEAIYKYSQDHISGGDGHLDIPDLEWDFYNFSTDLATGLDLVDIDPETQPIYLSPDTTLAVKLYLDAENSLLVTVKDINTGEPIPVATVRLSNTSLGYEEIQNTGAKGQTYFIPLEAGTYTAEVSREGFQPETENISILNEDKSIIISLLED